MLNFRTSHDNLFPKPAAENEQSPLIYQIESPNSYLAYNFISDQVFSIYSESCNGKTNIIHYADFLNNLLV